MEFVKSCFQESFPDYKIKLVADPDDDTCIFVYVFGVEDDNMVKVKTKARKLCKQVSTEKQLFVVSLKSVEITKEHYPEMV